MNKEQQKLQGHDGVDLVTPLSKGLGGKCTYLDCEASTEGSVSNAEATLYVRTGSGSGDDNYTQVIGNNVSYETTTIRSGNDYFIEMEMAATTLFSYDKPVDKATIEINGEALTTGHGDNIELKEGDIVKYILEEE